MADGGGGGEGGVGVAEWQPIYDGLEVMMTKSEARAEALAADRARLQAADRVHRESLEAARKLQRSVEELRAAAREKDAEMERLRAEAADARKKLQVISALPALSLSVFLSIKLAAVAAEGRRTRAGR
jgi:predicted RNase H-like nuclease (RuvC/YqgF family)